MKTLYESLLSTDYDISRDAIDGVGDILRQYKYRNKTGTNMPFDVFCEALNLVGTEIKNASTKDVRKAISAGHGFICVSNNKAERRTNWALYWPVPRHKGKIYQFDTVDQTASWYRPMYRGFDMVDYLPGNGLGGQAPNPQYVPGNCRFFEIPVKEYMKFLSILGDM